MAFGVYPEVSLADAREKRDTMRKLLAAGGYSLHGEAGRAGYWNKH